MREANCIPLSPVGTIAVMPAKNGRGTAVCEVHRKAAPACRVCVLTHLQEFRVASIRRGIYLATERITKLRDQYIAGNGNPVKAKDVSATLTLLLRDLEAAEWRVAGLPVDATAIMTASNLIRGRRTLPA